SSALVRFGFPKLEGLETAVVFAQVTQLPETRAHYRRCPQMSFATSSRDQDGKRRSDLAGKRRIRIQVQQFLLGKRTRETSQCGEERQTSKSQRQIRLRTEQGPSAFLVNLLPGVLGGVEHELQRNPVPTRGQGAFRHSGIQANGVAQIRAGKAMKVKVSRGQRAVVESDSDGADFRGEFRRRVQPQSQLRPLVKGEVLRQLQEVIPAGKRSGKHLLGLGEQRQLHSFARGARALLGLKVRARFPNQQQRETRKEHLPDS